MRHSAARMTGSDHGQKNSPQSFLVRSTFNNRRLAAPQRTAGMCQELSEERMRCRNRSRMVTGAPPITSPRDDRTPNAL
jgi:hypothetical protein